MISIDERQAKLIKRLAKDVSEDIETRPFDEAADRIEALCLVLQMIGADAAAETAQHLVTLLRTSKASHVELTRQLAEMLVSQEPTTAEVGK